MTGSPTDPQRVPQHVDLPKGAIKDLCHKYGVEELAVFGSALRDDFRPDSDVDFLVVFKDDNYGPWMGNLTGLEQDLSDLLGRKVDLVSKRAIEQSENYIRRSHILGSAKVVYVEG
jgi:predicted nucleotidyltransferase